MNTQVLVALIGAIGTVFGAILGALVGRSNFFDRLFKGSKFWRLVGKWKSTWQDIDTTDNSLHRELLVIERQNGSRIRGYITMEDKPDKRWNFEGNFSGRFLQLSYYPSEEAEDKLFLDYGCYFFEMLGDGSFKGHSIGFDYERNKIGVSTHRLERIK